MSAPHLPDDLRRWPRDPYQVLGIAPHCDPLVARKAYTGLIRHFKPEQFPEHFRLIREAYDAVKRNAQYFGLLHAEAAAEAGKPDSPVADTSGSKSSPVADASGIFDAPGPSDSLQLAWDMACNGEEDAAYGRLRKMYDINPQGSELPARLYALLLANPELDHVRTPAIGWCAACASRDRGDHAGNFTAARSTTTPKRR